MQLKNDVRTGLDQLAASRTEGQCWKTRSITGQILASIKIGFVLRWNILDARLDPFQELRAERPDKRDYVVNNGWFAGRISAICTQVSLSKCAGTSS